jgi:hypothetical protein
MIMTTVTPMTKRQQLTSNPTTELPTNQKEYKKNLGAYIKSFKQSRSAKTMKGAFKPILQSDL